MSEKPICFINPPPCDAPELQLNLPSIKQIEHKLAVDDTSMEGNPQ